LQGGDFLISGEFLQSGELSVISIHCS
jgi:hypothetical protein